MAIPAPYNQRRGAYPDSVHGIWSVRKGNLLWAAMMCVIALLLIPVRGQAQTSGSTFAPIRINLGGSAYLDSQNRLWTADTGLLNGSPYATYQTYPLSSNSSIGNTDSPALYQSMAFVPSSTLQLQFAVPNNSYTVTLKFAEIYNHFPSRVFDILLNGQTVEPAFNPFLAAGGENLAVDRTYNVQVTNGQLTIQLASRNDYPTLNALEITTASGATSSSNPSTPVSAPPPVNAPSPAPPASTVPINIMPLGDSITEAFNYPGGYRIGLYSLLESNNVNFHFVGSQANGPASLPEQHHEGHSGFTISNLASILDFELNTYQPDIVLLLIGTNDIYQNVDLANAPGRLTSLINQILTDRPTARVIVGSITPFFLADPSYNQHVDVYNSAIPGIVNAEAAQGKAVFFVDMHSALTSPADSDDGIHPSAIGYGKMATIWYQALSSVLNLPLAAQASGSTQTPGSTQTSGPSQTPTPAPGLTITSPTPGAAVQGTTVVVTYSRTGSSAGVDHIQFQLDGAASVSDSIMSGTYQFTGVSAGTHTVRAYLASPANAKISGTDASVTFTTAVAAAPPPPTGTTTVSIRGSGAAGNGVTDDTASIQTAINASPAGSTIDFGDATNVYLISQTINLVPNRNYTGQATVKMSKSTAAETPMFRLLYGQTSTVKLTNLNLDANQVGGILQVAVNGGRSTPADHLTIQNVTFQNTMPNGGPWDSAIYDPVGLQSSVITQNKFRNCGGGCIYIADPGSVTISYNDFDTTVSNAMFIPFYSATFSYGSGLEVSNNTGRNLGRMAIEIWGGDPGITVTAPVVKNNTFTNWKATSVGADAYGISVVAGRNAQILNNTLLNGVDGYGIECGQPGSVVSGNTISGFPIGIVVQGQPDVTVQNNRLLEQTGTGIYLSNSGNNLRVQILNNYIENPKDYGIGAAPNDYSGMVASGNQIVRQGGYYAGDANRTSPFIGVKMDASLSGSVTLTNNVVVQTALHPPAGFTFWGIAMFAGQPGSRYSGNTIASQSTGGVGFALGGSGLLDGSTVAGNNFVQLSAVDSGGTTPRISSSNNIACGVSNTDPYIVTSITTNCSALLAATNTVAQ